MSIDYQGWPFTTYRREPSLLGHYVFCEVKPRNVDIPRVSGFSTRPHSRYDILRTQYIWSALPAKIPNSSVLLIHFVLPTPLLSGYGSAISIMGRPQ